MKPHHIIPLDSATAGMTLSDNLSGSRGEVLLPAGAVLTAGMIASLKRHQVNEISVLKDVDLAEEEQNNRLKLEKSIERVNTIFKAHEHEMLNRQLKNYVIHYLTSRTM